MFLQQLDSQGESFHHRCKNNLRSKRSCAFLGKGKPRNIYPPPSLFLLSPQFRADKTPKTPFFALSSTQMLATQATVIKQKCFKLYCCNCD